MMAAKVVSLDDRSPQPAYRGSGLMRKLLLLLLLALAAALGLVILFRHNTSAPPLVFNSFADAALGFLMGMGSRIVLRRRNWFVRALTAAVFSLVGVIVLGQFTGGQSGVGPLRLVPVHLSLLQDAGIELRLPSPVGEPPRLYENLAHIVLAVTISWIALRAWNRPRYTSALRPPPRGTRPALVESESEPLAITAASVARPLPQARPKLWRALQRRDSSPAVLPPPRPQKGFWRGLHRRKPTPATPSHSRPRQGLWRVLRRRGGAPRVLHLPPARLGRRPTEPHQRTAQARAAVDAAQPSRSRPVGRLVARRRGLWRRGPSVRLSAHEEHRCPYCLEPVRRSDMHGSVECPVCHTLHHRDCWDVTGACQVPHLTA